MNTQDENTEIELEFEVLESRESLVEFGGCGCTSSCSCTSCSCIIHVF